jgi:hypothetical protein
VEESPAERWTSSDAIVVRHEPTRLRASLAAVFLALLSIWPPVVGIAPAWAALVSAFAILATSGLAILLVRGSRDAAGGAVTADGRGVFVGGALALAREDIAYGFVETTPAGARVKLSDSTHGLRLEVRVKSAAEGRELLKALGLDVAQRVAPFFAASPTGGARGLAIAAGGTAAFSLALMYLLPSWGWRSVLMDDIATIARSVLPVLVMLAWSVLSTIPTRVTVGADGLEVRWLRRRRFVPYRSILRVVPAFGQLRVVLADGTTLRLRGQRRSFTPQTRPEHRAMVDRMGAAIDEHLAASRVQEAVAQLPAPREDGAGWLRELEAVQVGIEGGYRRAIVSDEVLWRVVEDASIDEKTRAGAAVALRKVLGDEGRARLRVVAEATASPRLRVALEAASGNEEGAIAQSLDDLTAGEDGAGQRRRARGA